MKNTFILGFLSGALLLFAGVSFANYNGYFKDVPKGQWYTGHVELLRDSGIVSGYPDGSFKPGNNVTRAEVSVMLSKMLKYLGDPFTMCTVEPEVTDIGRPELLVNNRYPVGSRFLGALFSADDCSLFSMGGKWSAMQKMHGIVSNPDPLKYAYTLGSRVTLLRAPAADFLGVLKLVGFVCATAGSSESSCKVWELNKTSVLVTDMLKLKPFSDEIEFDDCINCG